MIIERIIMNVLKEKQTEVLQTLVSMIDSTCQEKGCISYQAYRDIEDESVFSLIAEWGTREDLDRHVKSDRFSVLLGTKSLLREPLKIWVYTVSKLEGMEAVNETRGKGT